MFDHYLHGIKLNGIFINRFISELVQTYLITVGPIVDFQSAPMALCLSARARRIEAAFRNATRFDWCICWPSDKGLQASDFFVHIHLFTINVGAHNRIYFDTEPHTQ